MNLIIKTKHFDLTERLRKLVEVKIGGLRKFLKKFKHGDVLFDTYVDLSLDSKHHRKGDIFIAEVKIVLPGKNIVAQDRGISIEKAIAGVKKELEAEIKKQKTKLVELPRRQHRRKER